MADKAQLNVPPLHLARRNPSQVAGSNRYPSGAIDLQPFSNTNIIKILNT